MIGCRLISRIRRRSCSSGHRRQADAITTCNKEHPNCGICDRDLRSAIEMWQSLNEPGTGHRLDLNLDSLLAPQHEALHPHASKQELMLFRRSGDRLYVACPFRVGSVNPSYTYPVEAVLWSILSKFW